MIRISGRTKVGVLAVWLLLGFGLSHLSAQTNPNNGGQPPGNNQRGRRQRQGNVDPTQRGSADRYRDRLEITDDAEWKAIQPRIQKVLDARAALDAGRRGTFDRGNRPGSDRTQTTDQNARKGSAPVNPAAETLQKAITEKASASDLKAAAAQFVASRKAKQADLEKAQEELRMVLTQRQESIAMLAGLL
jgi:hypothetical protein